MHDDVILIKSTEINNVHVHEYAEIKVLMPDNVTPELKQIITQFDR